MKSGLHFIIEPLLREVVVFVLGTNHELNSSFTGNGAMDCNGAI
jgi:hypothetical protein